MTEPVLTVADGGWPVDDLDAFPEGHRRYELTDGHGPCHHQGQGCSRLSSLA